MSLGFLFAQAIEMQQMTELWTGKYGNNGNLTEIWFDGGIEGKSRPAITAMLKKMQPKAAAFNGCVVEGGAAQNKSTCITPNALRWIGTEAGMGHVSLISLPGFSLILSHSLSCFSHSLAGVAPDPNWSTGFNKGGDPASDSNHTSNLIDP